MTEKRFVYIEHKGADYILDTPNWELDFIEMLGDTLEAEEIVDLLNELHEENKFLEINYKELVRFVKSKGYGLNDFLAFIGQFESVGINKEDWE